MAVGACRIAGPAMAGLLGTVLAVIAAAPAGPHG